MVQSDGGIDEVAAEPPKSRKRPLLVGASEAAEADHVSDQDSYKLSGLRHRVRGRDRGGHGIQKAEFYGFALTYINLLACHSNTV